MPDEMTTRSKVVQPPLVQALKHLQLATELLDGCGAPGQIAANVDLAINQLWGQLAVRGDRRISRLPADDEGCGIVRPS